MPNNSLRDLVTAPFRPSLLKKPEVWGGVLGGLVVGLGIAALAYPSDATIHHTLSTHEQHFMPLMAFPIGIGEESLFRGYLQTQLSEITNPTAGWILSSLAFGAAHIPNAAQLPREHQWRYYTFSLPLITSLGLYFGWLTQKTNSLEESVAVHAWYDFILFSMGAFATEAAVTGKKQCSFSFAF